jgi:hypothetical protein
MEIRRPIPIGRECPFHPAPRSFAPRGGQAKSFSRRLTRPSHASTTKKIRLRLKKREAERRKAHAIHCPRTADKSMQSAQTNLRAAARQKVGARSPSGASLRLASAVATTSGSAPDPRFLGRGRAGVLPVVSLSKSCELLADRSFCRPSGAPEPPGSGLQIRARAPHSLHFQVCLENTSVGERDSGNVTVLVTIVK